MKKFYCLLKFMPACFITFVIEFKVHAIFSMISIDSLFSEMLTEESVQ